MADTHQHGTPSEEELFSYLVSTFYSSAWMQMGKMANPMSNKVEKDMEQAQFTIDLLDMLKKKTEGNRTEEEEKLITRAIKELKMNFMEEKKKESAESKEGSGSEETESKAPPKSNIVSPDEAMGGKKDDDEDSGQKSNIWTP